jgi:predicted nucleic acid-binding protein
LETYAVLTRLPAPAGVTARIAAELVEANFGDRILTLRDGDLAALLYELAAADIVGGAAYDALIGVTARAHGARLVTADRRAATTYQRLGVDLEIVDLEIVDLAASRRSLPGP